MAAYRNVELKKHKLAEGQTKAAAVLPSPHCSRTQRIERSPTTTTSFWRQTWLAGEGGSAPPVEIYPCRSQSIPYGANGINDRSVGPPRISRPMERTD